METSLESQAGTETTWNSTRPNGDSFANRKPQNSKDKSGQRRIVVELQHRQSQDYAAVGGTVSAAVIAGLLLLSGVYMVLAGDH